MHNINSIEFYYDKMLANRIKTRLWWKIIPKSNVEHIKSNMTLITSIYTLLGTYLRQKYFKIFQASSRYFTLIQNISKYFNISWGTLLGTFLNTFWMKIWMNYIHDDVKHNLSMRKVVCLFCFVCTYEICQTGVLYITFLVSLESSWRERVHGLGSMTFGLVVQKFLNIEWFLH